MKAKGEAPKNDKWKERVRGASGCGRIRPTGLFLKVVLGESRGAYECRAPDLATESDAEDHVRDGVPYVTVRDMRKVA